MRRVHGLAPGFDLEHLSAQYMLEAALADIPAHGEEAHPA